MEVVEFNDVGIGVDRDFVARILAPVLDNAQRSAMSRGWVEVHVHDDGPGVDYPETLCEPGARGADSTGAGLGLPLDRRLATAAGGKVEVAADQQGGHFIVRPPQA